MHNPPATPAPGGHERRQHPRSATHGLSAPLGEVVDLSEAGVGIFRKGAPITEVGREHTLTLRHEEHALTLRARVARIRPLGFRRQEIGLELIDLTEAQRTELAMLTCLTAAPGNTVGPRAWVAA